MEKKVCADFAQRVIGNTESFFACFLDLFLHVCHSFFLSILLQHWQHWMGLLCSRDVINPRQPINLIASIR